MTNQPGKGVRMKAIQAALVACSLAMGWSGVADAGEIKFGVQNVRGADKAKAQWEALGKFLSSQTGEEVTIVPVKPEATLDAMKEGSIDFVLCNPVVAVNLEERLGAKAIASMEGVEGSRFAGVIFSKKGSGISKAADLKGKKVMGYQFGAGAGAFVFPLYHLKNAGVEAKDFATFTEAKKQDDIPLAVKAGVFDVGFVRTGVLEGMVKEGKVSMDEFEIVDPKSGDGFPLVHSTRLYTEFLAMASAKSGDGANKIKGALLKLKADDEAAKNGKIKGFSEPQPLDDMRAALKELRLPPYGE